MFEDAIGASPEDECLARSYEESSISQPLAHGADWRWTTMSAPFLSSQALHSAQRFASGVRTDACCRHPEFFPPHGLTDRLWTRG